MTELQKETMHNLRSFFHHGEMGHFPKGKGRHHGMGQGRLLRVLDTQGGAMTAGEISEALDIRPSSVSELIAKLENAGFVSKEKDTADKRIVNIQLTAEGKAFLEKHQDKRDAFFEQLFAGITEEQLQTFNAVLDKMQENRKALHQEWEEKHPGDHKEKGDCCGKHHHGNCEHHGEGHHHHHDHH